MHAVNENNFWDEYWKFQREAHREAWKTMRYRCMLSLGFSIVRRLFLSWIVVPGTICFAMIVMVGWQGGLADLYNQVFIGNSDPASTQDVAELAKTWHTFSVLVFCISYGLFPWTSPAKMDADRRMEVWWKVHADKLPGLSHSKNRE